VLTNLPLRSSGNAAACFRLSRLLYSSAPQRAAKAVIARSVAYTTTLAFYTRREYYTAAGAALFSSVLRRRQPVRSFCLRGTSPVYATSPRAPALHHTACRPLVYSALNVPLPSYAHYPFRNNSSTYTVFAWHCRCSAPTHTPTLTPDPCACPQRLRQAAPAPHLPSATLRHKAWLAFHRTAVGRSSSSSLGIRPFPARLRMLCRDSLHHRQDATSLARGPQHHLTSPCPLWHSSTGRHCDGGFCAAVAFFSSAFGYGSRHVPRLDFYLGMPTAHAPSVNETRDSTPQTTAVLRSR